VSTYVFHFYFYLRRKCEYLQACFFVLCPSSLFCCGYDINFLVYFLCSPACFSVKKEKNADRSNTKKGEINLSLLPSPGAHRQDAKASGAHHSTSETPKKKTETKLHSMYINETTTIHTLNHVNNYIAHKI